MNLAIDSLVKPAMMHLAYEIYSGVAGDRTVSKSWLIDSTVKYLVDKGRFADPDDATVAAEEFIKFCTGRAWVFSDVGLDNDDEPLYEFTHGTFLEFFAASYLVRRYPTPEELAPFLKPRLVAAEWDVVAQLALQIIDKNVEDGGSRFLALILDGIQNAGGKVPFFAARSLGYICPSYDVLNTLVDHCLRADFPEGADLDPARHEDFASCCDQLLGSQEENYLRVRDRLLQGLVARLDAGDLIAADFLLHCDDGYLAGGVSPERLQDLSLFVDSALSDLVTNDDLLALIPDPVLAARLLERGLITVDQAIEQHGLHPLLIERPSVALRPGAMFVSLAATIVARYDAEGFSGPRWEGRRPLVGEVGRWVVETDCRASPTLVRALIRARTNVGEAGPSVLDHPPTDLPHQRPPAFHRGPEKPSASYLATMVAARETKPGAGPEGEGGAL